MTIAEDALAIAKQFDDAIEEYVRLRGEKPTALYYGLIEGLIMRQEWRRIEKLVMNGHDSLISYDGVTMMETKEETHVGVGERYV